MPTLQRSPTKVSQTTGGAYVTFNGLDNIKNTSTKTYAISNKPILSKNSNIQNRPSNITCTGFNFKIPTNAIVKKITVYYRHSRVASCTKNQTQVPCTINNSDYRCNIPAPTLTLLNTNLKKKGQAPYAKIGNKTFGKLNNTATFSNLNLKANVVNNANFGVKIDYPRNANTLTGFMLLNYVYIIIDYAVPRFTVSAQTANTSKVYNKEQYHLKVNCSDPNLTKQGTNVLLTIPTGFTFVSTANPIKSKITQISDRTIQWTPTLDKGMESVELVFDTDISFAGGADKANFSFVIGLPIYATQITHSDFIYKRTPEMESEENDKDIFTDEDAQTTGDTQVWGTLNESFLLSLDLSADEIEEYCSDEGEFPLSFRAFKDDVASNDWYYSNITNETLSQLSNNAWRILDGDSQYIFNDYFKVLNELGEYTLQVYAIVGGVIEQGMTEVMIRELKIRIRPQQDSLTNLNYTLLSLTNEELSRLGDGFAYTVQSDVKLETNEDYVRDWLKNFRIGVFNNPLLENISTYYQYKNIGESFDGYIVIPKNIDLEGASIQLSANADILLIIDGVEYMVNSSIMVSFNDYYIPATFIKNVEENIILTISIIKENQEIYSTDYHICFNADETTDLEEIIVDSTDYDNLTSEEIINNAIYWSSALSEVNTLESISVEFPYKNQYPLFIIVTGDYVEGDIRNNSIHFTEPCIVESAEYAQRIKNGNYPTPISNLIVADSRSDILVGGYDTSDSLVFYELPVGDYDENKQIIRGIELVGEIEQADSVVLYAKLKSPSGESRERSVIINQNETDGVSSFKIGGNNDLWGFNTSHMSNFEDWEVEFSISNSMSEIDSALNFGEIKLLIYLEEIQKQNVACFINGEDISFYGAFLTDLDIPEGLETDTAYLAIDGSDINNAIRQNIREKTISISFEIGDGCSLESATMARREFAKLLVNNRDEYNRPIPKRIEFSHYPDVYWEYILEDSLDSEIDINTYNINAKLTIPAGTSYTKQATTTSTSGYVNGLASINPVLVVKPTSDNLSIRETISGQEFNIGYTGGWDNKILEIDCEDRICWLKENDEDTSPINLNKYVDYNSDWFVLKEDYNFEGVGCMIRSVSYQERW